MPRSPAEHQGVLWWVMVGLVLSQSPQGSAVDTPVQVSCRDVNGAAVDWFVLYKAPFSLDVRTGLEYIYIDASGRTAMSTPINDGDGVLAHTLRPMLSSVRYMPPSFGFLSYSDQPPGGSALADRFGHSKGVVLGDSRTTTALWITHSTPQFPFRRDQNNFWPPSGRDKGQTFLCISLPFSALRIVGNHLQNIQAYPYDYDLTNDFPQELRDAANWVTSKTLWGQYQDLPNRGSKQLKTMAKPVKPKEEHVEARYDDLYVMLASHFVNEMNAQTWRCQPNKDGDFCDTDMPHVLNVDVISTELGSWSSKQDHSKWAVTTKQNTGWTCFGDLNRSDSQYRRFGGAVCINDKNVNKYFKEYGKQKKNCSRKRPAPCDSDIWLLATELQMLALTQGNFTALDGNSTSIINQAAVAA